MKNIFTPKTNAKTLPHDIIVRHHNTATYGDKGLIALGLKIWNKLPANIKLLTSITKFKGYIRAWFGLVGNVIFAKWLNNIYLLLNIYLFIFNGFNVFI